MPRNRLLPSQLKRRSSRRKPHNSKKVEISILLCSDSDFCRKKEAFHDWQGWHGKYHPDAVTPHSNSLNLIDGDSHSEYEPSGSDDCSHAQTKDRSTGSCTEEDEDRSNRQ